LAQQLSWPGRPASQRLCGRPKSCVPHLFSRSPHGPVCRTEGGDRVARAPGVRHDRATPREYRLVDGLAGEEGGGVTVRYTFGFEAEWPTGKWNFPE